MPSCAAAPSSRLFGLADQRAEVRHGTDADEDQAGVDTQLDAEVEDVDEAGGFICSIRERDAVLDEVPVDMTALEDLGVEHTCAGQVRQQHTEGDRQEQQRSKPYRWPDTSDEGNEDHDVDFQSALWIRVAMPA